MSQDSPEECGCCAGIEAATPGLLVNRPGLSAVAYRVGTYGTFRQSLHARLSEGPEIGMEESTVSVRQIAVAEDIEQLTFDIAPEMIGPHTDMQIDFQRHELRAVDLHIMTGHAIPLEMRANAGLKFV